MASLHVQVPVARPDSLVADTVSAGGLYVSEVSRAGSADQHLPGLLS